MKHFLILFQITLSMISTNVYATKITLVHHSGQKEIIESGFGQEKFERAYQLIKEDQLPGMILEQTIGGISVVTHISSIEFAKVSGLLNKWISAQRFAIEPLSTTLVNENAYYVDSKIKFDRFFITNSLKKNPILYTDHICECVVVIGHNPSTKKGFLGHYSCWFKGNFKRDLMEAISKINEGAASDDDVAVNVRLVTSQASNFSQKVLETAREVDLEAQINFKQGLLELSDWNKQTNLQLVENFVDPKRIEISDVEKMFMGNLGRSIYFDSRDGQIYEQLPWPVKSPFTFIKKGK